MAGTGVPPGTVVGARWPLAQEGAPKTDVAQAVDGNDGQLRLRLASGRQWAERSLLWRIWERMLESESVDRRVALGAKAFISFFPLVIVVGAFVATGVRHSIVTTIIDKFGLVGGSKATVKEAFASSGSIRRATGVLGLVFLAFYATSITTALQRADVRAGRRPSGKGAIHRLGGLTWGGAGLAFAALLGALRHMLNGGPGTVVFLFLGAAVSIGCGGPPAGCCSMATFAGEHWPSLAS